MRWEDERYVRVYTRDTGNWITLSWEARALLVFLFRKVDRAGILDLGDDQLSAMAALVNMPIDAVERALPELVRKRSVSIANGRLTIPNFLEAQETRSSDAQRKRDQRERAIAKENLDSDGNVTSRHQPSPAVTDGHSVPICAVPSHAEEKAGSPPLALVPEVSQADLEALYALYPLKENKAKGMRSAKSAIKTESDRLAMEAAIKHYAAHLRANPDRPPMQWSTWCNGRWEEWKNGPPAGSVRKSTPAVAPTDNRPRLRPMTEAIAHLGKDKP